MSRFEITINGKVVSSATTLEKAMNLLRSIAASDFGFYRILEVKEVDNGKVINRYDLNNYWEGRY